MDVIFISTCQGVPDYAFDDSAVATQIVAADFRAGGPAGPCRSPTPRPRFLGDVLAEVDLLVVTRLHAAVIALCRGTPCIAILYERKTDEVFQRLGATDLTLDIESLDVPELCRLVDEALAAPAERWKPVSSTRWRAACNEAEMVAAAVREVLSGPRHDA